MSLNIIFAGTPDFAAEILQDFLKNTKDNLVAVYTQPDRPAGRGKKLTPSAVKSVILESNLSSKLSIPSISIEQPENFKKSNPDYSDNINKLKSYQPDLIIVVAYGLILPQAILDIPKYGCINIHASILPRWRGAAPIQRAIQAGDCKTGIAIQQMDKGLDTGNVLSEAQCDITNTETSISLNNKLLELAKPLLLSTIEDIKNKKLIPVKQDDSLATYAHKITKSESMIDFNQPAININRLIRAFTPWPGAQININNNIIKVWETEVLYDIDSKSHYKIGEVISANKSGIVIQCLETQLNITKLQFSGGKVISAADALNGKHKDLLQPGTVLSF